MRPRLRGGKSICKAYAPLPLSVKRWSRLSNPGRGGVVIGGVIFSIGDMGRLEGSGPITARS